MKTKNEELGLDAQAANTDSLTIDPEHKSLTERSINSLQWFYTIILSLAIVKVITQFITSNGEVIKFENSYLLNFIVFMILAIPFHQGANQYLNAAYLTKKYRVKKWTGLVDFMFFFIEGMVFYAMAIMFINNGSFYYSIIVLLGVDVVWILTVLFTNRLLFKKVIKWLIINSITIIAAMPILYFDLFKDPHRYSVLAAIMILRTIVDYIVQNPFYWPSFDSEFKEEVQ